MTDIEIAAVRAAALQAALRLEHDGNPDVLLANTQKIYDFLAKGLA